MPHAQLDPTARQALAAAAVEAKTAKDLTWQQIADAAGTIYRLYEVIQTYGTTLKALIHEQFGDGIISGINFRLDVKKVPDPEGGERAIITLNGKYLPAKPF
jgi:cyanate lyase